MFSGLLDPRTTVGKTFRTLIQAVIAQLLILLGSESFRDWVSTQGGEYLILVPAAVAVVTFVYNKLDPKVPDTQTDLRRNNYER